MGKPIEHLVTKVDYIRTSFGMYKYRGFDWRKGKVIIECPDGDWTLIDPLYCRQADWVDEE